MNVEPPSAVDRAALKSQIKDRLAKDEIREGLAEVLVSYYLDARKVATLAETMADGMRFDGLANEVYACFQHVARGLCEPNAKSLHE